MKKKKKPKHYWNFRVVTYINNNERLFSITEVHYKKGKPSSWGDKNSILQGLSDIKSLKWTHKKIKKCLKKPVLDMDHWPDEFIENSHKSSKKLEDKIMFQQTLS